MHVWESPSPLVCHQRSGRWVDSIHLPSTTTSSSTSSSSEVGTTTSSSTSSSSEVGTTSFVTIRAFSFSLNEKVGFGYGGLGTAFLADFDVVKPLVWDGEVMESVRVTEAFAILADMIRDARLNGLDIELVDGLGRMGTLGDLLDLITGADKNDFLTDRESFSRELLGTAT